MEGFHFIHFKFCYLKLIKPSVAGFNFNSENTILSGEFCTDGVFLKILYRLRMSINNFRVFAFLSCIRLYI